ncbi:threonine/serine exporter family protein [Aeromicrobium sp. IC_218]|uniref:threonine/serine ThrE exporter family protein n=1 Tax=Aeromicrobium sp. IC_218 TaxID=2545468 RepID=UPI00103DD4DD|nr:threonine/serine exporter family protein [Aeromicrobium sp. IC_218]TCI95641.1 threonine/serine exporter family protein [Aeromicrobium sp. IC_218]
MADTDDPQQIHAVLDLALRVGEMMLSNGAGAADVTASMSAVTRHFGLRSAVVDVTFTTLTISYQERWEDPPQSRVRHVTYRTIDYGDLTLVDKLVRDLVADRVDLDEARARILHIASTGHGRPRWSITLAYGFTGAGVAALLGGTWVVWIIAFLASALVEVLQRWMERLRLPFFYQQIAGGLLATLIAVAAGASHLPVSSSIVVTASIIMLLAGLGFIGAVQDALTGFPLTATARILEVLIATAGIIVGVSGGLSIASWLGIDLMVQPGASDLARLAGVVLGGAVCAAAFACSAYAPWRSLAPIAGVAAIAAGLTYLLSDLGRLWAVGIAAVAVGLVSFGAAAWARVPPLVVVVSAIVPILPGLSIYRGLALMAEGDAYNGIVGLVTAAAVALALASGVLFGEYVAQPLRREARKVEQRLAGPRLVGPLKPTRRRRRNNAA